LIWWVGKFGLDGVGVPLIVSSTITPGRYLHVEESGHVLGASETTSAASALVSSGWVAGTPATFPETTSAGWTVLRGWLNLIVDEAKPRVIEG